MDTKFRGKTKDGKWVTGDYYKKYLWFAEQHAGELVHYIGFQIEEDGIYNEYHEVDHKTVGQYTGLKDILKNELFKDDIVTNASGLKWVIKWDEDQARFCFAYQNGTGDVCKIDQIWMFETEMKKIGNIHDNPELLEVEK